MDTLTINRPTQELEIRLYEIDMAQRDAFLSFFQTKIKPWLIGKGVTRADVWLVERDDGLQFIFASTAGPPWDTFPEMEVFLKGKHPLRIQPLPDLAISVA